MSRRRLPRRSLRSRWRQALAVAGAILVVALLRAAGWLLPPTPPEGLTPGIYRVERVVDGDTLLLANGARIRLIGADTPETVKPDHPVEAWGPAATAFTRQFIASGKVRLEFDTTRQDRHGRFLAYVWVDDRMLNEELIREGLARARLYFDYRSDRKSCFRKAEKEASRVGRGLHSGGPDPDGRL